jgi:hypothetical protein
VSGSSSRGGRRASLPEPGWKAPERLPESFAGTVVQFVEEHSGRVITFDCASFPVSPALRRWMAGVLAVRFSTRSGVKRVETARMSFKIVHYFAQAIATCEPMPTSPGELAAVHVQAFRNRCPTLKTQRSYLKILRVVLREAEDLPASARKDLFGTRLPSLSQTEPVVVVAYTDSEWQQIMTSLRHDVRVARDRIRAGLQLLEQYRSGAAQLDPARRELGGLLDHLARTGDVPRDAGGDAVRAVNQHGGVRAVLGTLVPSQLEMSAFALLLTALTAENFGTVKAWPAAHHRPDGATGAPAVGLVEETKPRRGPDREHMVTALEDLPPSLRTVLEPAAGDEVLFHSPLRVYQLLLEVTAVARSFTGSSSAFLGLNLKSSPGDPARWTATVSSELWGIGRGFPRAGHPAADGRPAIDVRRIRQTALEIQRRPVSHTGRTLRDHYLTRSRTVRAQSRTVVAEALDEQVAKARIAVRIPVFTAQQLERATQDREAAAQLQLDTGVLKQLASGERDTAVVACTDHRAGPHSEPGMPCPASFLTDCLSCENARALPHQLSVQALLSDRLARLCPNLDPSWWQARYEQPLRQLQDILDHYSPGEVERARRAATAHHRKLVDKLLDGSLDLR